MITTYANPIIPGFHPDPHNPILSHRSLDNPIQCTGHGDLVEDHRGNPHNSAAKE